MEMHLKTYVKSLIGFLSSVVLFINLVVLICAITSGRIKRKHSTFIWSAIVSLIGIINSIGMMIIKSIPGIIDRLVKIFPKGVYIEIAASAVLCFFYLTVSLDNLAKSTKNKECLSFQKHEEFIKVHFCLYTVICYFGVIGCVTYGIVTFLSYRQWKHAKTVVNLNRQDTYAQDPHQQTISSIIL